MIEILRPKPRRGIKRWRDSAAAQEVFALEHEGERVLELRVDDVFILNLGADGNLDSFSAWFERSIRSAWLEGVPMGEILGQWKRNVQPELRIEG